MWKTKETDIQDEYQSYPLPQADREMTELVIKKIHCDAWLYAKRIMTKCNYGNSITH